MFDAIPSRVELWSLVHDFDRSRKYKPMRFSIVTPVLNAEKFLGQTILSAVGQAGPFTIHYHVQDGGPKTGHSKNLSEWQSCLARGEPHRVRRVGAFFLVVVSCYGLVLLMPFRLLLASILFDHPGWNFIPGLLGSIKGPGSKHGLAWRCGGNYWDNGSVGCYLEPECVSS